MPAVYHSVKPGEDLVHIAAKYGFHSTEAIEQCAENQELWRRREDGVLYGGGPAGAPDSVFIPDKMPGRLRCVTGRRYTFVRKTLQLRLRVALFDEEGEPLANEEYAVASEGRSGSGVTDDVGIADITVPFVTKELTITVGRRPEPMDEDGAVRSGEPDDSDGELVFRLRLGDLDPLDTPEGRISRLNNLGYDCGEDLAGRMWGQASDEALRQFLADEAPGRSDLSREEITQLLRRRHDEIGERS